MPATHSIGIREQREIAARRAAIESRRDTCGWTTKQLAHEMGMWPSTVHHVLAGRTKPGEEFIANYAALFGYPAALADLFGADVKATV